MQKTVLERKGAPTFGVVIELLGQKKFRIYNDVAKIVDAMLSGRPHTLETRWIANNKFMSRFDTFGKNSATSNWLEDLIRITRESETVGE